MQARRVKYAWGVVVVHSHGGEVEVQLDRRVGRGAARGVVRSWSLLLHDHINTANTDQNSHLVSRPRFNRVDLAFGRAAETRKLGSVSLSRTPRNGLVKSSHASSIPYRSQHLFHLTTNYLLLHTSAMGETFPEVEGGGSLILAWQVKNKKVLIVGGGEVS